MKLTLYVNGLPLPDLYCSRQTRHRLLKYLIAMKLFIATLIISLNVSASVYSQKINISVTKAPLDEVLTQIRIQTGVYFVFKSEIMTDAKPVTLSLKNIDIKDALPLIFKDQPFTYTVQDDAILVKLKPKKNLFEQAVEVIKDIIIRGKVVDDEGKPLPGASVKAGGKVAITNTEGTFELSGVDEGVTVEVSYIGYRTASVKAGSGYITVILQSAAADLNEVVINKGYYTTTRELNTGNVGYVGSKILGSNPVGDPLIALQGRVSGLSLSQTSGITGGAVNIRLRGQNSLRTGVNNPLFIVDGIPFESTIPSTGVYSGAAANGISPFTSFQLNDIESIEVLKDADATAIYGSRGANGVILITTKKAASGKTRIDLNVYQGAGDVPNRLDLMNTQEYLAMRRQALVNDGVAQPSNNDNDLNGKWGDPDRYTDWQELFLGGTANITNAQASVSGGNQQTQILFNGSYRRETTVYPGDYADNKYSGHLNINHNSENKRFKSNLSVSYVKDHNKYPADDFTKKIVFAPNAPELYNTDGTLNWQNNTFTNPLSSLYQSDAISTENLNAGLNFGYEILPDLAVNVRGGYSDISVGSSQISPLKNSNPFFTPNPLQRINRFSTLERQNLILEPTISYKRSFDFGTFDVLFGATWQSQNMTSIMQIASGFSSDAMIKNLAAASSISIENSANSKYRYTAVYARIGYNYQDQYLLNLTGRRDASSRFGPGKQFGNFGAAGAAWIFTKQKFLTRALPGLSFGKIRASYGITGNDQIGDYGFLDTYTGSGTTYQGVPVLNPNAIGNPEYGWETVTKLEFGVELGFLKDRLMISGSWYRNRTNNQLIGLDLPDLVGMPRVQANLPAVLQNKGVEIEMTTRNFLTEDFSWTTTTNFTVPWDKLIAFKNFESSSYTSRYRVGEPLSLRLVYQYTGLDPVKNIFTFQDQNKDNVFNSQDFIAKFFGQRCYGGVNNSFTYKSFQLDIFCQYVNQVGLKATTSANNPGLFGGGTVSNVMKSNSPDFNSENQKYSQSTGAEANVAYRLYTSSDARLVNTSFLRLKNVALSWNVPQRYLNAVKLQRARIYVQGQNLLTVTGYKGLDPETSTATAASVLVLPPLRMLVAGVQLTL